MSGWILPSTLLIVALALTSMMTTARAADDFPSADALPAVAELPDLLTFRDGSKVASAEDWTRRRAELLAMIQHYEYGVLPPAGTTRAAELNTHQLRTIGVTHRQYKVTAGPAGKEVSFVLDLLLPPGAKKTTTSPASGPSSAPASRPARSPVILRGDWGWHKTSDEITKLVLSRGYALAEFNRVELAPDNARRDSGLYVPYPDATFGSIAAWAWGFSRCVDVLVTLPEIDPKRIAVTGHSRGGKAALLAGALDDRIALTNPNGSGCGGTACYRDPHPKAETMAIITKRFPYWFTPTLREFVGRESRLPFDQHALRACVAPRALIDTQGLGDEWASPPDARRTHDAAQPVFALLGAPEKQAFHHRPGPHEHNVEDWSALLDFADRVFADKPTTRNLDMRPPTQAGG